MEIKMETKITRAQYMNGEASFEDFYGQFVTPSALKIVMQMIGVRRIMESTDLNLNDIPLQDWDRLEPYIRPMMENYVRDMVKEKGRDAFYAISLSDVVCAAKVAALRVKYRTTGDVQ